MNGAKKFSRKREAVLEAIRSTKSHPSAEWVYMKVKSQFPDISLGTVYRNIASFVEDGTVISIGNVNGQSRYDGDTSPHSHFICGSCGAVIDIQEDFGDTAIDQEIQDKYGFDVAGHQLLFYGTCQKCKSALKHKIS